MKTKSARNNKETTYRHGVPAKYVARDLAAAKPQKEQFEPTTAEPVRQRYRMAGGC